MELNDFILAVAIGIAAGFGMIVLYAVYLYHDLKGRVDRMIQEVIAEHEASMVGLDIELDNGVYFCYNTEDKQFVCQGASVVEVAQAFRKRYPGKTAYLAQGEESVLARFRAELDKMRLEVDEASCSQ
jgi:hypothetical protein